MKKHFEVLRKCRLFDEIEDNNLTSMLGCLEAKIKKFHKGESVFSEGDPAKYLGIVLSGQVQIIRVDYYGNRSIVTSITPSQIFGESFACAGLKAMPVNVVATENCEIMLIDTNHITHSCSNACSFHSQLIFNLLNVVAKKNLIFNQKIEITSKRSTREKLMTYLLIQAKNHQSSSFAIPYDRQELADYLEVERSGLSAEISKMRNEGIISCKKNQFTLNNQL